MIEKMYTPEDAAEILSLKRRTIMEWLRTGVIRGVKIGGVWRIPESALDELVKQGSQEDKGK